MALPNQNDENFRGCRKTPATISCFRLFSTNNFGSRSGVCIHGFQGLLQRLGNQHTIIATSVLRGYGQAERLNRILIPILAKLSASNSGEWHKHLNKTQQYINHVPTRRTGLSPFTLLFGTRIRLQEDPQIAEIVDAERTLTSWNSEMP